MGAAGAFMMATSSVIVTDAFPKRQLGQALGINMMTAAASSTLGVVVGGVMTSISWEWVFCWFNVPLGVIGTIWAAVNLRELVTLEHGQRLDLPGNATFLVGILGLLIGLTQGGIKGWTSPEVISGFVAAAIFLPTFLIVESKIKDPLLSLSMFRSRTFAFGNVSALLNSFSRFAVMFAFYFIGVDGYDHLRAGILLIPLAGVMFLVAPISGWFADRAHARVVSTIGMLLTAAGLFGMGTFIGVNTPYWQIAVLMIVVGAGSGIFNSPNTRAIMNSVGPEHRGLASGTRTFLTNIGGMLSIAVALSIITSALPKEQMFRIFSGTVGHRMSAAAVAPFISGFHEALLVGAAASLIGAAFSALRGRNPEAEESSTPEPVH
jgi:MFS family permease